jgi:hypothetical protein
MGCHIRVYEVGDDEGAEEREVTVPWIRVPPVFYDCTFGNADAALWFLKCLREGLFTCDALDRERGRPTFVRECPGRSAAQEKCCSYDTCSAKFDTPEVAQVEEVVRRLEADGRFHSLMCG